MRSFLIRSLRYLNEGTLSPVPTEAGHKSNVLKTFYPDLRDVRSLLVKTIPDIVEWLRANPEAKARELGEWICDKAQFEKKRAPRVLCWRKLERWLPQINPTLEQNLAPITSTVDPNTQAGMRLWQVAHRLLANYLEVSPSQLQKAMERTTRRLTRDILRQLIGDMTKPTGGASMPHEKKRPGPQGPRKKEVDKNYFKIGHEVQQSIPRMQELIRLRRKSRKELLGIGCSESEIEAIHMPGSRTAVIAARWLVSIEKAKPFDVVGEYH